MSRNDHPPIGPFGDPEGYEFREVPLPQESDGSVSKHTFDLMVLLFGCLLHRLGGQQTFTIDEIDTMRQDIEKVRIIVDSQDRIVLRIKAPE